MAALRLAVRRFCDRALGRSAVLLLSYLRLLSLSSGVGFVSGMGARSRVAHCCRFLHPLPFCCPSWGQKPCANLKFFYELGPKDLDFCRLDIDLLFRYVHRLLETLIPRIYVPNNVKKSFISFSI